MPLGYDFHLEESIVSLSSKFQFSGLRISASVDPRPMSDLALNSRDWGLFTLLYWDLLHAQSIVNWRRKQDDVPIDIQPQLLSLPPIPAGDGAYGFYVLFEKTKQCLAKGHNVMPQPGRPTQSPAHWPLDYSRLTIYRLACEQVLQ